ncbi:MAG: hypothetical protein IAI48_09620 [Candidatus Eremiobacteraeota bacterium]|nr:hypothetical protein [Candidatus Eremiobacteraeota bacterium]
MLDAIDQELRALEPRKSNELREARYEKFRRIGAWENKSRARLATALT